MMRPAPAVPAASAPRPARPDEPAAAAHGRWDGDDLLLDLLGKPGARRDAFGRVAGGRLAVQIAAVAEAGKATARLLDFLAAEFGVAKSAVELVYGAASPNKQVRIRCPQRLPAAAGVAPRPPTAAQAAQERKPANRSSRSGGK